MTKEPKVLEEVKSKIHTIRGKQVMLDSDLAELYGVDTRSLNQAVRRNMERFPERFAFRLNREESVKHIEEGKNLKSQNVISSWGGRRKPPYVFTEQGVAMLSSVLKSKKAAEVNVKIMDAFVAMRKFLGENKELIQDLGYVKSKVLEHDDKINKIFDEIQSKDLPDKGIFYNGQVFDAHKFASDLIRKAKKSIILIDNYVDENTLNLLTDKKENVKVTIYTKNITKKLELATNKFNEQYKNLEIKHFNKSHDRFLIIDEELYHIGASLKDLGKKWFAFSRMDSIKKEITYKLRKPTKKLTRL